MTMMWSSRLRASRFRTRSTSPSPSATSSSPSPSSPVTSSTTSPASSPASTPIATFQSPVRRMSRALGSPSLSPSMSPSPPPMMTMAGLQPISLLARFPSISDLQEERERWGSGLEVLEPRPLVFFGGLDSMVA